MITNSTKTYSDGVFTYYISESFDDHLIIEGQTDEDYVEVQMDDCSEYEREIYDFLTKMEQA